MDKEIKLTDKEKYALCLCDDGFGWIDWVSDRLEVSEEEAKKILDNLYKLELITFDPYKDKDLRIYEGLRTEKEIEDYKKNHHPIFYTIKKGEEYLQRDPYIDKEVIP